MSQRQIKSITLLALFGLIDAQQIQIDQYPIRGTVMQGYEPIVQEYLEIANGGFDNKSQLAVYKGDELIIDLYCDKKGDYSPDHLQTVLNSGMSVASILMGIMADQGRLRWDAPVTDYWPDFGQSGKGWTRVEDVMRHEAGLPILSKVLALSDISTKMIKADVMGRLIASESQMWFSQRKANDPENEVERAYHAFTRDMITNEIFRRVEPKGRTMGEYLREEFPDIDVFSGIQDDKTHNRVQDLSIYDGGQSYWAAALERMQYFERPDKSRFGREYEGPPQVEMVSNVGEILEKSLTSFEANMALSWSNAREWRATEIVSANISASARGLAKLGAYMAQRGSAWGRQIMSERSWNEFHDDPTERYDMTYLAQEWPFKTAFSKGGVAGASEKQPESFSDEETYYFHKFKEGFWGWMGLGGSIFQWNPEQEISFAYTPTDLTYGDYYNFRGLRLQNMASNLVSDNDLRDMAGYSKMKEDGRRKFDQNLVDEKGQTFSACNNDYDSDRCRNSKEIRRSNELSRRDAAYYYDMGLDEQKEFDMSLGAQKLIATAATLFTAALFI